jgi:hypothetical protein
MNTGLRVPFSPATLICGADTGGVKGGFRKIKTEEAEVKSNIPETEDSARMDRLAAKLFDGSLKTLAEPGATSLDYGISFFDDMEIKKITIHWKDYGINDNYINAWKLEASPDGAIWDTIAEGNSSPRTGETVVDKRFIASALRLTAQSAKDWIGVYEIEIIGRPR